MSATTCTVITCDEGRPGCAGKITSTRHEKIVRFDLRKQGWWTTRGKDYCPAYGEEAFLSLAEQTRGHFRNAMEHDST